MTKLLTDNIQLRNGAKLTNRIAMAPMQTFSGLAGGFSSEETVRYYSARSQAAGLLITEFHYVSDSGGPCSKVGFPEQLGIYSDQHIDSIAKIARALKKDGNKAVLQIHHGGREASGRARAGKEVVAPSAEENSSFPYNVRELTDHEIEKIVKDFGLATKRAIQAGFDGVEIHGANHYLLQQFFSQTTNKRTDQWGGSLTNRIAFPLAVVKEVKRVVAEIKPKNFIIGYRISPQEIRGNQIGYTYKESLQLIEEVVKYELDYIHLSISGRFDAKPDGAKRSFAELFKEKIDEKTKLMVVGSVFSEKDAIAAIEHYTDLIAIGRGTLLDPQFGQKIISGRGTSIVSEISPERLSQVVWTTGLTKAFTTDNSLRLPPLPGRASIMQ